jgi:hypothetical protein
MFTRSNRTALFGATAALTVALGLTGCSATASNGDTAGGDAAGTSTTDSKTGDAKQAADTTPGLNTPVTVGAFEYTALAVKDAGTTVGTAPLSQTAQGTFFQVDLKVANTGTSAQTFIVNYVKLKDAAGKTYDADASATLYASSDPNTWISAINPGNAVQGPILFDVPAGTKPVTLLVSDNAFTAGKQIAIG